MRTHNIHFHDKVRKKIPKIYFNICFLKLSEEFSRGSKTSSSQPGKRAIGVGVTEVLLHDV